MSYILEALKKAEAERRSGIAHAAPLPPGFSGAGREGAATDARRWLWIAALLAAVLPAVAWLLLRGSAPPSETVIAAAPSPAIAAVKPDASSAAPVAPPIAATAAEPPAIVPAQEKPVQEQPAQEKPVKKKPEKKAPRPTSAPAARASKESSDEAPIAALNDLPASVRSEIPPLTIGGYIYSGNRTDRSVLINQRLLREGDEIAPGLTLEQMTRSGMVLNYKGYRYRAPY